MVGVFVLSLNTCISISVLSAITHSGIAAVATGVAVVATGVAVVATKGWIFLFLHRAH